MANRIYKAYNGPAPTGTAQQLAVTTGTAVKTLMQLSTPATLGIEIVNWGISFDGSTAATPIKCELLSCTGGATVTAYVAADIIKVSQPTGMASQLTLGAANSGYTSSAEGTPANWQVLDEQFVAPTNAYWYDWALGNEPTIDVSRFVRVRVTAPAAVNALTYVTWRE